MPAVATSIRGRLAAARRSDRQVLFALVVATVLLRLPYLTAPLGLDEAGYAYVAGQWFDGQGSLYGGQWVDRPPLLFALYGVAQWLAGDAGIRLLGTVAAIVVVLSCAEAARRLAGSVAMRWTGLAATVLMVSTVTQSVSVNAELPAIACTAASVLLAVCAAQASDRTRSLWLAASAGAVACCAVLVKQSFVDGFAFAAAYLLAWALLPGPARPQRARRAAVLGAAGFAGAALVLALTAIWAEAWGPGVAQLLDALYGFRVDARSLIEASPEAPRTRAVLLVLACALTGMLSLAAFVVLGLARLALWSPPERVALRSASFGLLAYGALGFVGVVGGGNWWLHYLMQPVPFLAIGVGVVVANPRSRRSRIVRHSRRWTFVLAITTLAMWIATLSWFAVEGRFRSAETVSGWVRAASEPQDTVLVTWGHANVLHGTGLRTPYRLAWSLPVRVEDPELRELGALLRSPGAPTWIIEWRDFNSWQLDRSGAMRATVAERYERVTSVCGKSVYRLRDVGIASALLSMPSRPSAEDCDSGRGLRIGDVKLF